MFYNFAKITKEVMFMLPLVMLIEKYDFHDENSCLVSY